MSKRKGNDVLSGGAPEESTLAAFSARVNPILVRIQQQQGLDRFKVAVSYTHLTLPTT